VRRWHILAITILLIAALGQTGANKQASTQEKSNETHNSPPPVPPQVPAEQRHWKPANPPQECSLPAWTDPFWSNWALVVIGVVTAWVGLGSLHRLTEQTSSARVAAEEAKQAAIFSRNAVKASERADVLLEAMSILPSPKTGQIDHDSHVALRYKNFGRSRAKDVRLKAEMVIEGVTLGRATAELPVMALGAGQDQTISFETFGQCLTKATSYQILRGEIKMWINASVIYEDAFGDIHANVDIGLFDARAQRFRIEQKTAG
jgi:hypothetical protein